MVWLGAAWDEAENCNVVLRGEAEKCSDMKGVGLKPSGELPWPGVGWSRDLTGDALK